jgi:1-aminocyclopropane-1-carboxylate deaminase/D-cysteine desulfhydrase-like pyridoxal-dependent ACC family enzyme
LGGNKARNLEFILGEALDQGVNSYIATGSVQSNACRQVAAAGAQLGLPVYLLLKKGVHNELQGNRLLDDMFGATVRVIEDDDRPGGYDMSVVSREVDRLVQALRAQGLTPGVYPAACSSEIPAAGYLNALLEMERQFATMKIQPTHLVVVSGSGSTHAALTLGVKVLNLPYKVVGISIRKARTEVVQDVSDFGTRVAFPVTVEPDDVLIYDAYRGPGYAIPTDECLSAIDLVARCEGILLDPVYTGKAMAGVVDLVARRVLTNEHTVVFVHTGGVPAIFAYSDEIARSGATATSTLGPGRV